MLDETSFEAATRDPGLLGALAAAPAAAQIELERPPINYVKATPDDAVSQLQKRIVAGEVKLSFDSRAFAVICGRETFSTPPRCPADTATTTTTCSGTWPYTEALDCTTIDVQLEAGRARAYCGNRTRATGGVTSDAGETRHHARFVVEL